MLTALALAAALAVAPPPEVDVVTRADVEQSVHGMFVGSWTQKEKWAWTASTIAHVADLATSLNSGSGCEETNPILGKHPSTGALVGLKVVAIGFEYWLQSRPYENTWMFSAVSAAIHGAVAVSNTRNDCYGQP